MYPSKGRHLLPQVLRQPLGSHRIRSAGARRLGLPLSTTLGELDEGVWRDHSPEAVRQLAGEVVRALNPSVFPTIAELVLFADRPAVNDVVLSNRAMNALRGGGLVEAGRLRPTSIGDVLDLPNFGAVSLLDLLTATDALGPRPTGHGRGQTNARPSPAVCKAAQTLARKRWATSVSAEDPRVGHEVLALDPYSNTAREAADSLAEAHYTPSKAKETVAAIRRFVRTMDHLRRLTLETEMDQIVSALTDRESARTAVLARTGLTGEEPMTLEMAGRLIRVTRERVRQLEKKFFDRIATCSSIWTPVLDRALDKAAELIPTTAAALDTVLHEAHLVARPFSVGSFISAAEIFGKKVPFTDTDGLLVPVGNWAPSSLVRSVARRLVEHWGATTIADVELRLREEAFDVNPGLLLLMLETTEGFGWLDRGRGWFWIRGTRNRLLNHALKILSVAGSIEIGELRAGVGRHHRMKGFRPPREVLAALCVESGLYRREGERIIGGSNLPDWRDTLGNNERLLVQALFDYGPVMRRDDLERVVVAERGLNRSSFYVYLTYSPVIERYGPGVFGLRGAPVTAAEVDAMIPPRVRHQVLQDGGWTDDGRLWAAFRISPACESTGILGAPAAVRAVARGQFELSAEDGRRVGTLVIEQNMWGLTPFFRRWGVEAGDFIVIVLSLPDRRASISVGTDELLLRYQVGE